MRILSRRASQNLANSAMSAELNFGEACKLLTVYFHASVPITEEVTVTFKSDDGSEFDTAIDKQVLRSGQDYVFAAAGDIAINEFDSILVEVTNANGTGTMYVTAKAEK